MVEDELRQRLEKKGWTKTEIEKSVKSIETKHYEQPLLLVWLQEVLIWASLLTAIFGNFVISVALVPFLLILRGLYLYTTILVVGGAFGILFTMLLQTVEKFQAQKRFIPSILIPSLALINMYIIAHFSNDLITILQLDTIEHSPALVSLAYLVSFIAPYLIIKYTREVKNEESPP